MLEKFLESLASDGPVLPNRFTIALGKQIRLAREEAGMSQAELAHRAYFKQSSISKIESGIRAVSAEEILYLCFSLNKPILYFFPPEFSHEFGKDDLSIQEKELISLVRNLDHNDFRKLIAQVKALVNLD